MKKQKKTTAVTARPLARRVRSRWEGQTPDRELVTSKKKYLAAWYALKVPLQEKLGLTCIGFDPGFLMCDTDHQQGTTVDIPTWLAKRIVKSWASNA